MDWRGLAIILAFALSLPAGIVAAGALAQNRTTSQWLRPHVRAMSLTAAAIWGALAVFYWHEGTNIPAGLNLVGFLCMVWFAIFQRPPEAERAGGPS